MVFEPFSTYIFISIAKTLHACAHLISHARGN